MREVKFYQQPDGTPITPETHDELYELLQYRFGLTYPRKAVCPGHTAPFDALAEAYFREVPVSIWIASRGFGGKTTMMAGLALVELLTKFEVVILGGSGEQTARVHQAQAKAWDYSEEVRICPECEDRGEIVITPFEEQNCLKCGLDLVKFPVVRTKAPHEFLKDDPRSTWTVTREGNALHALTASTKSARGPHPQRLRMDEADEMDLLIVDAAMGQTMVTDPSLTPQTVFASTHHYEAGTMTELLKRAQRGGWPIRRWCYKETLLNDDNPGSWLLPENIEQKKTEVTSKQWRVEYDLEVPSEGGTMFDKETLQELFMSGFEIVDTLNEYFELEPPEEGAEYSTGADWGRKTDLSVIATIRIDVEPARLVAWERHFRQPWPVVIDRFNERVRRYPGEAAHDATGIGDVVDGYLEVVAEPIQMVGKTRSQLFLDFEKVIETHGLVLPQLESLRSIMEYLQRDDLYGGGHPPDEVVALSMAIMGASLAPRQTSTAGGLLKPRSF